MAHTIDHGGVDPLTYLAEHRRHLGVVHVVLSGGKAVDTPSNKVTIEVDPRDPSVLVLDAGRRGVIRLPMAAAPGQRRVLALGKDEIEFQLRPADRVLDNPNPVSTVRPPLSAQELDDLQPTALRCTSCSRTIARLAAQTTWRNLPSAHWREIADAWLCHPKGGNDFTQRYARKMKEGIWPEPGIGLVGLWEVLLDGSVASGDLVMSGSSEILDDWQPLACRCGASVGSHSASPLKDDLGHPRRAIKLLKHMFGVAQANSSVVSYPPERYVVSEMLEIFQTHSTPRFFIKSEADDVHGLLVWLFAPDVEVTHGTTSTNVASSSFGAHRHCRLLYMPVDSDTAPPGPKHQPLTYAAPIYEALGNALKASTQSLPPSQRAFGQHRVAILPRS